MIRRGHIKPIWSNETILALNFKNRNMSESSDGGKTMYIWEDFDGAQKYWNNIGMNVADSFDTDDFWKHDPWPDLDNKVYAVHYLEPGMIQPLHGDLYRRYSANHGITNLDQIYRIIVFLADWQMGHIFHCDDKSLDGWRAGDWVGWSGTTRHIAANFGKFPRYTLQITGTI